MARIEMTAQNPGVPTAIFASLPLRWRNQASSMPPHSPSRWDLFLLTKISASTIASLLWITLFSHSIRLRLELVRLLKVSRTQISNVLSRTARYWLLSSVNCAICLRMAEYAPSSALSRDSRRANTVDKCGPPFHKIPAAEKWFFFFWKKKEKLLTKRVLV